MRLFKSFSARVLLDIFFALWVVALATVVTYALRQVLATSIVALLYLLTVMLSTSLWGLWPGVADALGAFLAFNFFFIPPYNSLFVHQTQDVLALLVFLAVAIFTSQLVDRTRASLAEARARQLEAIRLHELSSALVGVNDDRSIMQVLARQALETFQAAWVDVAVFAPKQNRPTAVFSAALGEKSLAIRLPEGESPVGDRPTLVVPMQSSGGLIGELRLYRARSPLTVSEERLAQTFTNQGGLALERAWLSQSATRERVLEESDRLKSALLASVSHELRTPLATIKASVTSLRSQFLDWEPVVRDELLAAIEEETDHLNLLVGNLLNMSRLEAGALEPQRRWNVLSEIVRGVLNRARSQFQNHTVALQIPDELPLVPMDYVLMEQVFTNLLSNSAKYSPPETVITVRAWTEDNLIQVQVSNQGPPVAEEHLERIFDKFNRVTAAERVAGTGLGLSICKGLVEAHGGRIWAENLPAGFAFNFTLPLTWEGGSPRLPTDL